MKMNHKDALNILGIEASTLNVVGDEVSRIIHAYRQACSKYHPDRNPAGLEMMKMVNAAYEALQDVLNGAPFDHSVKYQEEGQQVYGDELNAALNALHGLNLTIEICGSWIWVSGDTRPHKEALKAANFKWAPKKMMWHFRPSDHKSMGRGKWDMDKIRETYGSSTPKAKTFTQIERAA